ncbi:MAG: hypothetical protein ACOYZ7_01140 [Chloroflexota bacterium]
MNTRQLQRHYDKLSDLERFRLTLAADARNDESELIALRNTARRATYNMIAWPYAGMFDGLLTATWAAVTDILWHSWIVTVCLLLEERGQTNDDFVPSLAAWDHAAEVVAVWDGLGLFCAEVGIELDHALRLSPVIGLDGMVAVARAELEKRAAFLDFLAAELAEADDQVAATLAQADEQAGQDRRAREYAGLLKQLWDAATR